MKREIGPYIELILLALDRLDRYMPTSKEAFLESEILQDAVLLQLLQVGENLARIRDIAPELFEVAPDSWHRVIGLRNLIVHEYRRVNADRVWRYLKQDLAAFRLTIEALDIA